MAPWLRERGHDVTAVDLPGRHGAADADQLQDFSITDYVAAVVAAIRDMPAAPAVIGHSMGGLLALRASLEEAVAGVALVSSVPPTGLSAPAMEMAMGDPLLFGEVAGILGGDECGSPEVLRRALFSDAVGNDEALSYLARFQSESRQAVMALHGLQAFNPLAHWGLPILVLGGAEDRLISPAHVHWTATLLGRRAEIIPGIGHAVMLEPAWIDVAERIEGWLAETFTGTSARAHG